MHNVAPSRALARRTRQLLTVAFVAAAIGTFIAVAGLALFVVQLVAPNSPSYSLFVLVRLIILIIGIIVFFVALVLVWRALTLRKDNDLAMVTGRFLAQYLDDRYHFIRNVSKRGIGYIDAVLVGPPGVLVFRILDNRGIFANEGANWLRQDPREGWTLAGIEPTRECVQDIKKLREYLAQNRLGHVPVYGVIVFIHQEPQVQLSVRQPTVPVTTLRSLLTNLGDNYLARERIDDGQVAAVVQHLYDA
ncbi:MAG: nuclease-related domain-containing protein [Chloroflexota bacterium]|nr:MAG: hypothetical protein DIU68_14880 [Chloroflexota bacterium]